jgi:hypothetical protein
MTDEETWESHYPEKKMPGTSEPLEGRCGAKMRNKELKELGLVRYCGKTAGMGTDHFGVGTCKYHLGSTLKHTKTAVRTKMTGELATLSEQLGEAVPIGPPEVEAWILASKMKQWSVILEGKLDELNGILEVTDKAGIEHVRALIEVVERAWERYQSALEFMMKYDLRKRVIELEEHQAQLVGSAFMTIILNTDLKLSESQIAKARDMFATAMTELGGRMEPSWISNIIDVEE